MAYTDILKENLQLQKIAQVFLKGNKGEAIKDLQHMLNEMGFGEELKWDKYGADGDYGNCTTQALISFGQKNNVVTDGQKVTPKLAQKLIDRYELVESLTQLKNGLKISQDIVDTKATTVLQTLLSEIGFEGLPIDGIYDEVLVLALKTFGSQEGIPTNGRKLNKSLTARILEKFSPFYGNGLSLKKIILANFNLSFSEFTKGSKNFIQVADDNQKVNFNKHEMGVSTLGQQTLSDFLQKEKDKLVRENFSPSVINVLISVAENEGNLDAINTYDNSFLSFGIFQWTLGTEGNNGELPVLLEKIKAADAAIFHQYFGKFGIDVTDTNKTYGYLTLEGKKIDSIKEKTPFRKPDWAFRFWNAGQNFKVKSIEAQHAIDRLRTFYWRKKENQYSISQLITSEYGVALILDNHVNRPGYVRSCITKAMQETGLRNPIDWTTSDEQQLIDAYLRIRLNYGKTPMTHASKRASVTKKYLDKGIISKERGSFSIVPKVKSRGLERSTASTIGNLKEYPPIRDYDEE